MSKVEFEDTNYYSQKKSPDAGVISNMIVKLGLAKNAQSAQKVLLIIVILGFAWTFYYYFGDSIQENQTPTVYFEDLTQEERQNIPKEILETFPSRN